jgi:hypothetical protein
VLDKNQLGVLILALPMLARPLRTGVNNGMPPEVIRFETKTPFFIFAKSKKSENSLAFCDFSFRKHFCFGESF